MDTTSSTHSASSNHVTDHLKQAVAGMHFQFPQFKHEKHGEIVNVNDVIDDQLTLGQKVADIVAGGMGSWNFIIGQASLMIIWIVLNLVGWFYHWDVYPFVLLNLAMSAQAAFATPLLLMSQNRQAEKDRLTAQNDYQTDCKGEEEVRFIMEHLDHQDTVLFQLVKRIEEQHAEIKEHLVRLDPTLAQKLGIDVLELSKESLEGDEIAGNS